MKRAHSYYRTVLMGLSVVALGLSSRCLQGDDDQHKAIDAIRLADARRVTQVCEEVVKAYPPGDRSRQWTTERDNLLAAVRELPERLRREGSAVREGFAWYTAGPVTEDTFDIKRSLGFLTPHRPGISPGPSVLELRAQYFDRVSEGMSSQDAAQILGKPDDSFEQNTLLTGYQKTVLYALADNRTAFLWFGSDDRLTYKYRHREPGRIEAGPWPSRDSGVQPAVAKQPVTASSPPPVAKEPAPARALPTAFRESAATPDPVRIQIGDTVLVPAHSSLRTSRSTISLPTDLRLCVVDVRGDHIGCLLRYADGDEAIAWVDRSLAVRAWQNNANPAVQPIAGAAPPLGNEPVRRVGLTAAAPPPAVRSQPSVYGSSIITFDNQSGQPALVRLVGPTRDEVYVAHGGRSSIRRVAAGEYVVYVRYGAAGAYRWTRGEHFSVQEVGANYSHIAITLHTVPSGNYGYRESSEAEFNQAFR